MKEPKIMVTKILALAVLCLVYISDGKKSGLKLLPGRLILMTDSIEPCDDFPAYIHMYNWSVENAAIGRHNALIFKSEIKVDHMMKTITQAIIRIRTCEDGNLATCQPFQTWRFGEESCSIFMSEGQFWSPLFRNIKPDMHCPIKAGHYVLRNGSIDVRALERLPAPLERFYWRSSIELYDPNNVFCGAIAGRFVRSKS